MHTCLKALEKFGTAFVSLFLAALICKEDKHFSVDTRWALGTAAVMMVSGLMMGRLQFHKDYMAESRHNEHSNPEEGSAGPEARQMLASGCCCPFI